MKTHAKKSAEFESFVCELWDAIQHMPGGHRAIDVGYREQTRRIVIRCMWVNADNKCHGFERVFDRDEIAGMNITLTSALRTTTTCAEQYAASLTQTQPTKV